MKRLVGVLLAAMLAFGLAGEAMAKQQLVITGENIEAGTSFALLWQDAGSETNAQRMYGIQDKAFIEQAFDGVTIKTQATLKQEYVTRMGADAGRIFSATYKGYPALFIAIYKGDHISNLLVFGDDTGTSAQIEAAIQDALDYWMYGVRENGTFPDVLDGDHSYEAVCADIDAWLPKMKPGGYITGDDFLWPGVKKAVFEKFGGYVQHHIKRPLSDDGPNGHLKSASYWWVRL